MPASFTAEYEITSDSKPWVVKNDATGEIVARFEHPRQAKAKAGGLNLCYSPRAASFLARLESALEAPVGRRS